jgi:hypothetical protein
MSTKGDLLGRIDRLNAQRRTTDDPIEQATNIRLIAALFDLVAHLYPPAIGAPTIAGNC